MNDFEPEDPGRTFVKILVATMLITLVLSAMACDDMQIGVFGSPSKVTTQTGSTPKASPSASPSATPTDPCKPVVGIKLSGPTEVVFGTTFKLDITPISPSGPLEGVLDYCNIGRVPVVESTVCHLRANAAVATPRSSAGSSA